MNTVVVHDAARLLRGKSAMLTPTTRGDRFRVGSAWKGYADLEHGLSVDEVNHFGRHATQIGDTLQIRDETSMQVLCQVQVIEILSVQTLSLDADFLAELGFSSRADFEAKHKVGDRRMWLVRVMPVNATSNLDAPAQ